MSSSSPPPPSDALSPVSISSPIDPMAATCKRPAASVDGQPGAMFLKRRRLVGTTGDYDQESCLGKGMFGVVTKARHRATGQLVAIKSFRNLLKEEEPVDAREVLREAHLLELCGGHPHIVGSRGVARDYLTGELCLVMYYVDGQSLHRLLKKRSGGIPEAMVRTFMRQLLTAVKEMHGRHVVHRDINPANILVGREEGGAGRGFVKICDFGVAMSMAEAPPYKEAGMGLYRAPEMLLGKEDYDALVDTWSLGCVMAEMLTGERIFQADDFISLMTRIFQVVGVPDDATWPGFTSLPRAAPPPLVPGRQSTLRDLFPEKKLSAGGFKVLNGLLTCNPDKRLTAAAALKLPWLADVAANAPPASSRIDTTTVSIKEEEVEFAPAPSMLRRKRVTARKTLLGKKTLPVVPPVT